MATKKSRGRQKVDMVKMENEQNLIVTFSKRRLGIFKKASELCTQTGSEVALLIFSPAEKAYAFGNPNVNAVIERFQSQILNLEPMPMHPSNFRVQPHSMASTKHWMEELTTLQNQMKVQKTRGKTLKHSREVGQSEKWWESPLHELCMEQLQDLVRGLLELKKYVKSELQNGVSENATKSPVHQEIHPFGIGFFGVHTAREYLPSIYDLFPPYAGPSNVNVGMPFEDETPFLTGKNVPAASVPYDRNAPGLEGDVAVLPNPQDPNHGPGGGGLF